ncbi:MAG: TIGR00266 family protein [Spirochaetales bacterium]
MKYAILHEPVFSVLELKLKAGETVRAEAGAMICMSPSIELKAKTTGKGLFGALGAAMGGEKLFTSEYTAIEDDAELILGPAGPGDITHLFLKQETILAQSGSYLAGDASLELSSQGSFKAMIAGEGLFLQRISGTGDLWLSSYGAILQKELAPGEEYIVDTGNLVAFDGTMQYSLTKAARSLFSTFASGEGIICRFRGPGRIWIQTRNISAFAQLLFPFFPKEK